MLDDEVVVDGEREIQDNRGAGLHSNSPKGDKSFKGANSPSAIDSSGGPESIQQGGPISPKGIDSFKGGSSPSGISSQGNQVRQFSTFQNGVQQKKTFTVPKVIVEDGFERYEHDSYGKPKRCIARQLSSTDRESRV